MNLVKSSSSAICITDAERWRNNDPTPGVGSLFKLDRFSSMLLGGVTEGVGSLFSPF